MPDPSLANIAFTPASLGLFSRGFSNATNAGLPHHGAKRPNGLVASFSIEGLSQLQLPRPRVPSSDLAIMRQNKASGLYERRSFQSAGNNCAACVSALRWP